MLNQNVECHVRRWTLVFMVLAAILVGAVVAKGQDPWQSYRAVCQINTPMGQGSGTLIGRDVNGYGLVLTCRHVAEYVGNPVTASFIWAGNQQARGGVIAVQQGDDFASDLALIKIWPAPLEVKPVRVARFNVAQGPWVGAGFRGGWMRITPPTGAASEQRDGSIMFQQPLVKGMSGGAFFNRRGELVAVTVGSDFVVTGIAADGVWLHSMLARYLR